MRGFTLWQPMAWGIAEGHKPVENRIWTLPKQFIGQRIAIHAGKRYDPEWATMIRNSFGLEVPPKSEIALGAVVAVATFTACIDEARLHDLKIADMKALGLREDQLDALHDWFSGPYGFIVADVCKLSEPVPCRGFQGLWNLPPEIEKEILEQLSGARPLPVSTQDAVDTQFRQAPRAANGHPPPTGSPKSPPKPTQMTLLDPIALERKRCVDIILTRMAKFRELGSQGVPALLDIISEIDPNFPGEDDIPY